MASNSTIAHRFANKDYNMERGLKGNSTHIAGNNYYSYSTVFGQWVDEKLCIVYWGDTSITSSKHKLYPSSFPRDVVLLPYDDGGTGYYGSWHGCDLLGWRGKFDFDKRVELIDYYVNKIYDALAAINGGIKKNLENHARRTIESEWGYVMKLCALYRDTTINKWLRVKRIDLDGEWKRKKKLVKELDAQNMDVQSLVDIVFGEGTWKAYYDHCARYRKADDNKARMIKLCNRLGIGNPYEGYHKGWECIMSVNEIRKLTAAERIEIHFDTIMAKNDYDNRDARKQKRLKNKFNAYKWIVGYDAVRESKWNDNFKSPTKVRNMFTGEEYVFTEEYIYGFYWAKKFISFDYDAFRLAADKEEWIRNFYAECKEVYETQTAILTLKRVNAHTKEKEHSWDDEIFINDAYLYGETTKEEYDLCVKFIAKQDKHYADEEARRRAAEIARLKREEEERKEREYMEQVKQEQIDECLENGIEGCRDLWRKHLMDIHYAERETNYNGDFFMGGNVLLRFGINKDKIESSKHIRVTIPTCKAMWKVVRKWHEHPETFKEMNIKTLDGSYTISSYRNDILTAGCHDIAYAEMEHMYNEIVKLENEAA